MEPVRTRKRSHEGAEGLWGRTAALPTQRLPEAYGLATGRGAPPAMAGAGVCAGYVGSGCRGRGRARAHEATRGDAATTPRLSPEPRLLTRTVLPETHTQWVSPSPTSVPPSLFPSSHNPPPLVVLISTRSLAATSHPSGRGIKPTTRLDKHPSEH